MPTYSLANSNNSILGALCAHNGALAGSICLIHRSDLSGDLGNVSLVATNSGKQQANNEASRQNQLTVRVMARRVNQIAYWSTCTYTETELLSEAEDFDLVADQIVDVWQNLEQWVQEELVDEWSTDVQQQWLNRAAAAAAAAAAARLGY
jgi:hypothetical protein